MQRICSGQLKRGNLLENEEELSRGYQVSRMTARAGAASRQGAWLCGQRATQRHIRHRPKLTNGILVLDGFTDKLRKNSFSPSWRLVQQAIRTPDTRFSLNA
jgi:GntR family transcriptional regulator